MNADNRACKRASAEKGDLRDTKLTYRGPGGRGGQQFVRHSLELGFGGGRLMAERLRNHLGAVVLKPWAGG